MILLAGIHDPSSWAVAAVAVIAGLLLMRSNRYYGRPRQEPPQSPPPSYQSPPTAGEEPQGVEQWEVHMHDTARDLSAQLDSKLSALGALVAEADRAAARLEAALERAAEPVPRMNNQARSLQRGEADERGEAAPRAAASRPRRQEEIYTLADYGYEPAEIARRVGTPVGEVELILSLRGRG